MSWKECLANNAAWDTLTWFAALIAMAAYLNKFGFIPWLSESVVNVVGGLGLSWQPAFGIIVLIYFYSHYFFASGAAHIGAMYTAFLAVAKACGAPGMLAALALGQVSNLMGCLTTYGIGSAPPYFGAGYVGQVRRRPGGRLQQPSSMRPGCAAGAAICHPPTTTAPPHLCRPCPPSQADWLKFGFIMSLYYLAVWTGCALTVWKALGLW